MIDLKYFQPEENQWAMHGYDNPDDGCEKCGRLRVCLCENGKHRCEKCNWCPEAQSYVSDYE